MNNEINNSINYNQKKDCENIVASNIIRRIQINKQDNQESLLKLERNYSYIEAIKDEKYKHVNTIKVENKSNNQYLDCKKDELFVSNEETKDYVFNEVKLNVNTSM